MKRQRVASAVFGVAAIASVCLLAMLAVGCEKKADEPAESPSKEAAESVEPAAVVEAVATEFANVRCPIMGSEFDLAKVPDSLVRDFKGKKVAFCCDECPAVWDKLAESDKEAKLLASK